MKITKLSIKNIGLISEEVIEINKPMILFYGEVRQGKSTILNAVRWVCGGQFPQDIIRHGEKEASILLEFDGGMIGRSFYINAKGETIARAVTFVRDGKPIASPINEIKRLLNPFMLDQDHLVKMSELERKRYFTELFAVDTTDLDKQIWNKSNEASSLRSKISGYGEIDVAPVLKVDVAELEVSLSSFRKENDSLARGYESQNQIANDHNATVQRGLDSRAAQWEVITDLEKQLAAAKAKIEATEVWLKKNPRREPPSKPVLIDTSTVETKLREAGAQNVRHENYLANIERNKQKQADERKLLQLESEQRELKEQKLAKLKEVNANCQVDGLKFDDDGNFEYQGSAAGMLSTSQIMTLSSELSALYPDGLGLELLDRGESLGKSIFGFVDRAQREKKTILATVVGERPANVPENIGVFIVEKGEIK